MGARDLEGLNPSARTLEGLGLPPVTGATTSIDSLTTDPSLDSLPIPPIKSQPERLQSALEGVPATSEVGFIGQQALSRATDTTDKVITPEEAKLLVEQEASRGTIGGPAKDNLIKTLNEPLSKNAFLALLNRGKEGTQTFDETIQQGVTTLGETVPTLSPQTKENLKRTAIVVTPSLIGAAQGTVTGGPLGGVIGGVSGALAGANIDLIRREVFQGEEPSLEQILGENALAAGESLVGDGLGFAVKSLFNFGKTLKTIIGLGGSKEVVRKTVVDLILKDPNRLAIKNAEDRILYKNTHNIVGTDMSAEVLGNSTILQATAAIGRTSPETSSVFLENLARKSLVDDKIISESLDKFYGKAINSTELGLITKDVVRKESKRITTKLTTGKKIIGTKAEQVTQSVEKTREALSKHRTIWETQVQANYDELTQIETTFQPRVKVSTLTPGGKGDVVIGSVNLQPLFKKINTFSPKQQQIPLTKTQINSLAKRDIFDVTVETTDDIVTVGNAFPLLPPSLNSMITSIRKNPELVTFSDAQRLRSTVLAEIRGLQGLNVADTAIKPLQSLAATIGNQMEDAANIIGKTHPSFLKKWKSAQSFFKAGAQLHREELVTKFLSEDPVKAAKTLLTGDIATWTSFQKILGKNSPEMNTIKRFYVDKLLSGHTKDGILDVNAVIDTINSGNILKAGAEELFTPAGLKTFQTVMKDTEFSKFFFNEVSKIAEPEDIGKLLLKDDNTTTFKNLIQTLAKPSLAQPNTQKKIIRGFLEAMVEKSTAEVKAAEQQIISIGQGKQLVTGNINAVALEKTLNQTFKKKIKVLKNLQDKRGHFLFRKELNNFELNVEAIGRLDPNRQQKLIGTLFEHSKISDLLKGIIVGSTDIVSFAGKRLLATVGGTVLKLKVKTSASNLFAEVMTDEKTINMVIKALKAEEKGNLILKNKIMDAVGEKVTTQFTNITMKDLTKEINPTTFKAILGATRRTLIGEPLNENTSQTP